MDMIRQIVRNVPCHLKPWAVSRDGVVKFESLTKESLEGAIKVMRESFFIAENLCKAVGLLDEPAAVEEFLQTCYDTAKDGVSIVANDTSTNEIVGVIFNKIQVPAPKGESYYEKLSKNYKHSASKAIIDFTIDVENRADLFKRYNANCYLEIMYIATNPDFKQRKIAQLLVSSTWKLGQKLYNGENIKTPVGKEITNADAVPSLVSGLTTSNYSQKLCVTFGFDNVLEVNYDDFMFDGRRFSERIGNEHKTCRLVAKRLSDN